MGIPHQERLGREVVRRLREAGHQALFAGGCVRDRLLDEHGPIGDVDVATSARPEVVESLFPRTVAVGKQFGVIIVVDESATVEVATFRSDGAYTDGRHPESVRFARLEEDAERRDFTINGMYADPDTGEVVDLVGGRDDLRRRVVRAIGDPRERFSEDKLRMLRAVRFAARFRFDLDPGTARAIREMAGELGDVSNERIGDEIVKILTEGSSRWGIETLSETGLLPVVLPELEALKGVEQGAEQHPEGDVWEHTMLALQGLDESALRSETLALGVALHDVSKPECAARRDGRITFYGHCERGSERAEEICRRLRRPGAVAQRVAWLVRNHLRTLDASRMRRSTLIKFLRQDGIDELLELTRIDALAASGNLSYYDFCQSQLDELRREGLRPTPLLGGRDLIALGFPTGPRMGEILTAVEEAQLEGRLRSREEAIAFVRKEFLAAD